MLSSELRDKLFQFIESAMTVTQLEEWLVPRMPFFLRSPETADADVVAAVELGLVEVSSGVKTVDELRQDLKNALREYDVITIDVADAPYHVESGSANQTTSFGLSVTGESVFTVPSP